MTDTIVLLAISQVICLVAVATLYVRVSALQRRLPAANPEVRRTPLAPAGARVPLIAGVDNGNDLASLAARMHELGLDVPSLARRMHRSEDEVRALLRSHGVYA